MKNKQSSRTENHVFPKPAPALIIMAETLNISVQDARKALQALAKAGYYVAPQEPTNAMLEAYMRSFGHLPKNPQTYLNNVSKARKRWRAMGAKGMALALSCRLIPSSNELEK